MSSLVIIQKDRWGWGWGWKTMRPLMQILPHAGGGVMGGRVGGGEAEVFQILHFFPQ